MSYLKLGRTQIVYKTQDQEDTFLIVSEVLDSYSSYNTPKLISTVEDLDLYFGKNFTRRNYYEELLGYGVTLLLYRPIKEEEEVPVINLEDYTVTEVDGAGFPWTYDSLPEDGKYNGSSLWIYKIGVDEKQVVWFESDGSGMYVGVDDIPTEKTGSSFANRDSLRLIDPRLYLTEERVYPGSSGYDTLYDSGVFVDPETGEEYKIQPFTTSQTSKFYYCHPKYRSLTYHPEYSEPFIAYTEDGKLTEDANTLINSFNDEHYANDDDCTVGFRIDFSKVEGKLTADDYIVLYVELESGASEQLIFYFPETNINNPPLGLDVIQGSRYTEIIGDTLEDQIEKFRKTLSEKYKQTVIGSGKSFKFYSNRLYKDIQFTNIKGLTLKRDFELTQNLYSILSENYVRAEFFSKTIGPGDEFINVKIEKLDRKEREQYRITISRFEYTEYYEGPLYLEQDESTLEFTSLEKMINSESKLVEVKFYNEGRTPENPNDGLIPGEYVLKRSTIETPYTPEDYWRALEYLRGFEVSEDFLMIPVMENYISRGADADHSWIYEYEKILEYAEEKNCQALISNYIWKFGCTRMEVVGKDEEVEEPEEKVMYAFPGSPLATYKTYSKKSGWTTVTDDSSRVTEIEEAFGEDYKGNYIHNYTKDPKNRLVYFFGDMLFGGDRRPSYYMFLRGIITGRYQESLRNLVYYSPADPYAEDETDLKKYKSNFLSCNDHIFYYREFFSHIGDWKYDMTILTRFCMDKVTNTVMRDFPAFLGSRDSGEIIMGLKGILASLTQKFPIISYLRLSDISEDTEKHSIDITLDLGVKEMLEHDINLSVTLNFIT